jgi:hypothetical protein
MYQALQKAIEMHSKVFRGYFKNNYKILIRFVI